MENDCLIDGNDGEELRAEPFLDDYILRAFISNACGDDKRRRVLLVRVGIVSVFTFNSTLQLFHGLSVYDTAGFGFG